MTQLQKEKIIFTIVVALALTIVNIIKHNSLEGYVISLVIAPIITWLIIDRLTKHLK